MDVPARGRHPRKDPRRPAPPVFAFCALLIGACGVASGQPAATGPAPTSPFDGRTVSRLTIRGLVQIDEAYVRNQIRSRAGDPYSQAEVQEDVGRLYRTGRFLDVRAEPQLVGEQIELTFTFAEKPAVAGISFVGNEKFDDKDLREPLSFAVGDPLDLFDVRQGQDAIERKYKEKGYAYVEVTFDEELIRRENRVVYTIVENQRVRVRKIRFEGNVNYPDRELEGRIATKKYFPIFRTGDFDPDRAERDAAELQKYHRDRGFLDAEVSYVVAFQDVARERLEVTFRVNEGTRYHVKEIRFEGVTLFSEQELTGAMNLKVGEPLLAERLQNDARRLTDKYGRIGYIYAEISAGPPVFADESGLVIVTLSVKEGEQYSIGWIEVNGNYHTQEKCVRRELRFYPEEIFDSTKLRDAEKRLKGTRLFTSATVEPTGTGPDVRDVLVTVEESPDTNRFIAGVGVGSNNGFTGNIVIENTNFDLFDTPRSWEEFFKGRSFRGAGQTMSISLRPGTEVTEFRIDFREPYLLDKPIGFGTGVYLFSRDRDGYTEERAGGSFSFDKRFESGPLEGWAGEVAFRTEYVNVADRDSFAAKDIREVDGGNYLSTIKFSLVHDTTDSDFEPSEGHAFRASWEQAGVLGGEFYHSKLTSSYARHWTVNVDDQNRKSVVSARANVGQILGDAPVFERFYAGGIGSMRGFDYRGISPRDGLRDNRVGGDFMVLTGAEYSFPLYAKAVRGVFFVDMGTVEEDFGISSWRAAVGGGIRLTLDILGTVPMEFDLAFPVSKNGDDDERIFSFFIGLPFF